ncbi:MAG: hypothetical protein CMB81_03820 [Flammeovirgaceae bacterium]|nr:hypothetical protein [Flammeovirgaceae bacterium]
MEVTINTSFFAEWYMNVYSGHIIFLLSQLKSNYDYNSILISVFIISVFLCYYKINASFFFKKYFNLKHIIYLGNKEDFFYRSSLSSFQNIFPLVIYSLILSFFSIFIINDSQNFLIKSINNWSILEQWVTLSFFLLIFFYFRVFLILAIFLLFEFNNKYKKIYLLNFIRVTINISFINMFISYLVYEAFSFNTGLGTFIFLKMLLVMLRPIILYNFSNKIISEKSSKIILLILLTDVIPSLVFFDPIFILNLFDQLLNYFY